MADLLVLLLALCSAPPRGPRIDTIVSVDGSRSALVVPRRATKARRLPLVVWLHGGIGANNPSKGVAAAAGFAAWADSGGFALLAPSAWPASPWWSASALSRVLELVRRAGATPGVDASRLVLAGVSDGGSGALWMAGQMSQLSGKAPRAVAVWSTDPSVLVSQGIPFDPTLLRGQTVRWTAGGRDRLYPIQDVTSWWERLRQSGVALETRLDPMADHDLSFHVADLARFPAWVRSRANR